MTAFKLHDLSTAPSAARTDLAAVKEKYGFVPNLMAVMAEAPTLMKAYLTLSQLLEQTSLSATTQSFATFHQRGQRLRLLRSRAHAWLKGRRPT